MMDNYNRVVDRNGRIFEQADQPGKESKSCCGALEDAKVMMADKLDGMAITIEEKTAGLREHSDLASYGNHASEILHQSAGYVREFDYDKTEAEVRGYIRQKPGQSLMIAGGIGLLLGLFLRHR